MSRTFWAIKEADCLMVIPDRGPPILYTPYRPWQGPKANFPSIWAFPKIGGGGGGGTPFIPQIRIESSLKGALFSEMPIWVVVKNYGPFLDPPLEYGTYCLGYPKTDRPLNPKT